MYGTIFRLQPKSDRQQDIVGLFKEWKQTVGANAQGARATYLLQSERRPGELVAVAIFDDETSYRKNADNPDQDAWYRRLRDALESDPVWEDGEYLVAETIDSGTDGR